MRRLRILIADDHEVTLRGLRALLEDQPGWEICGEATTGRQAVEMARRLKPDVAILDVSMPELNGLEATAQILQAVPRVEVVVLTVHESEQVVRELLKAGARGYLLKSDAGRELVAAINAVSRRQPYFTSKVSQMVLAGYLNPPDENRHHPAQRLTAREREIMQLLAEGKSNKEVAGLLGISVKTAETHRTNLMHKLDLHSMSELVRYAVRNNIIQA